MVSYGSGWALIVVDVQNDFADPAGSLYVAGGEQVVPRVNQEVAAARAAGAELVFTTDWHPPQTPHFTSGGGPWPAHCIKHTWGAALHPDLVVDGDILRKGTGGEDGYSAFAVRDPVSGVDRPTGLAALLRARNVTRLVVVGLAGDVCVAATALDGIAAGFGVTVLRDATASVNLTAGDEERAFAQLSAAGVSVR
ncbi:MAG: isochorismatase family protein [Acidimicrobiales bacterium]